MKKKRRIYILVLLFFLVLFLISDRWYFMIISIMGMIYPVISFVLLKRDIGVLKITNDVKAGIESDGKLPEPINLIMDRDSAILAVGMAEVYIEWENLMTGEKEKQVIRFYPNKNKKEWKIPVNTLFCGKIRIVSEKIRIYDIFGIMRMEPAAYEELSTVIYPGSISLKISQSENKTGDADRDTEQLLKKGSDITEIYDFRKYQPGDRLCSIHWKLSSKFDDFIVRQPGETIHTDMLIVLDIDRSITTQTDGDRIFNLSAALVRYICSYLSDNNINFMVSYLSKEKMVFEHMTMKNDIMHFMEKWLTTLAAPKNAEIVKYFNLSPRKKEFSNIIYITGGKISDKVYDMADNAYVHAICVTQKGEKAGEIKRENCQVTEIPFNLFEEKDINIVL